MIGPLECKPSLVSATDSIGILVDLTVLDYKSLFRMDLDSGTASAEAPDPGESFFRCRRAL